MTIFRRTLLALTVSTILAAAPPVVGQTPLTAGTAGYADDSFYVDLYSGIEERFLTPEEPSMALKTTPPLVWSKALADASILQLVPLLAILEYGEDATACRASNSATSACLSVAAPFGLMTRWPLLADACPASLAPTARVSCFFAAHELLVDLSSRLSARSDWYRLGFHELGNELARARRKVEEPDTMVGWSLPIRDYDDVAREIAELDAVILSADYIHLWGLGAAARLRPQACAAIGAFGGAHFGCSMDLLPVHVSRVKQDIAAQLRIDGLLTDQCSTDLCRWLAVARNGTQQTKLTTWSATHVAASNEGQFSAVSEASVEINTPGDEVAVTAPANGQNQQPTRERPAIWVRGGKPFYFPRPAPTRPVSGEPDPRPAEPVPTEPEPGDIIVDLGEVTSELPTGLAYAVDPGSWLQAQASTRRSDQSLSETFGWLALGSEAYDRVHSLESSRRTRFLKRFDKIALALDFASAYAAGDKVAGYASVIGFLGGPATFVFCELADCEGKLSSLEKSGIDVDSAMSYSLEQAMTFHFSTGQIIPYSQTGFTADTGRIEPALPSEIVNLKRRQQEAEEDKMYNPPCSRRIDFLFGGCR